MKRLYIALAFLILVTALCTIEQVTVKSAYENATKYIDNAIEATNNNDFDKAKEECDKLAAYWDKKYSYMTAMIEHSSLDSASVTINALSDLAKSKNDELETELIDAKNQMKIIYEGQRITFGNVF